jgi:hypothetical protein
MRVMMTSINSMSGSIHRALIAGCAVLYAALLVMSTGCTFAHTEQVSSQHHHHGEEGSSNQSVLCAWTCQATTDATIAIGPPPMVTALMVCSADLTSGPGVSSVPSSSTHPRAPPAISFVRLG